MVLFFILDVTVNLNEVENEQVGNGRRFVCHGNGFPQTESGNDVSLKWPECIAELCDNLFEAAEGDGFDIVDNHPKDVGCRDGMVFERLIIEECRNLLHSVQFESLLYRMLLYVGYFVEKNR